MTFCPKFNQKSLRLNKFVLYFIEFAKSRNNVSTLMNPYDFTSKTTFPSTLRLKNLFYRIENNFKF